MGHVHAVVLETLTILAEGVDTPLHVPVLLEEVECVLIAWT